MCTILPGFQVAGSGSQGLVHAVQALHLTEPHPQPPWFVFLALPFSLTSSSKWSHRDYKKTPCLLVQVCQKGKDERQLLITLPATMSVTEHGGKRSSEHPI